MRIIYDWLSKREISRLKIIIEKEQDNEIINILNTQKNYCELLNWNEYKLIIKGWGR